MICLANTRSAIFSEREGVGQFSMAVFLLVHFHRSCRFSSVLVSLTTRWCGFFFSCLQFVFAF
jgi:hypothetical protein